MTDKEFNSFVSNNSKFLMYYALKLCAQNILDAEDLYQDTLLKLKRNLGKYDSSRGKLITFITNMMRNLRIDSVRRAKNRTYGFNNHISIDKLEASIESNSDNRGDMDLIFGSDINTGEFTIDIDIIYKAIHSLRECDAKLIIMRMEGYSYLEIGEVLEMPLGTVKGNISRARKQITEKLSMNGVELLDKSA